MGLWTRLQAAAGRARAGTVNSGREQLQSDRLRPDGGDRRDWEENTDDSRENETTESGAEANEETPDESDGETVDETDGNETAETAGDAGTGVDASNVEVTEAGEAEPAEPRWDRVDPDDIPEFEIRADRPAGVGGSTDDASAGDRVADPTADDQTDDLTVDDQTDDPTTGRPNTARSPGHSRIKRGGTEGYIVALELCARLPDDIRLPEEAADLVPAAVEAELERDIRAFAAAEFETATPSVETLSFVEVDDEIWMRLRLGISPDAFADLDPDEIREHALEQLEGVF